MDPFTIFILVGALIIVWSLRKLITLFIFTVGTAMIGFLGVVLYFTLSAAASVVEWLKKPFKRS